MKLMQLIKLVLDDAYAGIKANSEAEKDELIKIELGALTTCYGNLSNKAIKPIDYSNPLKRFAYIYKYTVAHADYIMQLISGEKQLRDMLKGKSVEVACLGGGPGSDLLGILKYMMNAGIKDTKLTCYIFDKERAWGDSWSDVAIQLTPDFQLNPVFQQLDVTEPNTWKSYQKFLRADLFTLSFFLSEVWKIKNEAQPFFDYCLSQMKPGAMILFVDNNSPIFYEWFDTLAKKHNLKPVYVVSKDLVFSNNEEKTDLGKYLKKFGWPKRKSDAAIRIMKKA